MSANWINPVLLAIIEGRSVQEEEGISYVQNNADDILNQIKMLSENGLDVVSVKLIGWCLKLPLFQSNVTLISSLLSILNKLGRSEEFHRQCCKLPCCTAKEVIKSMQQSSFQLTVLRIASEIFLLQDLLNPNLHCCTKELLLSWLGIQKEEMLSGDVLLENVSKMLGVVEEFGTLCTFVEVLYLVFSSQYLSFCTDLALKIFQSKKQEATKSSFVGSKEAEQLSVVIEVVAKLFKNFTPLHSECLLSAVSLSPSVARYMSTSHFLSGRTNNVPNSACKMLPIDIKVYNSVLQLVSHLRCVSFDRQQPWIQLRVLLATHFHNNGYSLSLEEGSDLVRGSLMPGAVGGVEVLLKNLSMREEKEAANMSVSAPVSIATPVHTKQTITGNAARVKTSVAGRRKNARGRGGATEVARVTGVVKAMVNNELGASVDGCKEDVLNNNGMLNNIKNSVKNNGEGGVSMVENKINQGDKLINNNINSKDNSEKLLENRNDVPSKEEDGSRVGKVATRRSSRIKYSEYEDSGEEEDGSPIVKRLRKSSVSSDVEKKSRVGRKKKDDDRWFDEETKKNNKGRKGVCKKEVLVATRKSPRKLTQSNSIITTSSSGSLEGEEGVKPCVCDGCGEVVPDCSWLTAHIVVCPGMNGGLTGGEDNDLISQESIQSSIPIEENKKNDVKLEEKFDETSIEAENSFTAQQQQQLQEEQLQQQQLQQQQIQQHHIATMNTMEELKSVILGQQINSTNPTIPISNATSVIIQNPKPSVCTPVQFGLEHSHNEASYCEFQVNTCVTCGLTFYTEEALLNHVKTSFHQQSNNIKHHLFSCLKCGMNFLSKQSVAFHYKFVCKNENNDDEVDKPSETTLDGGKNEMEYRCWLCQKVFISELFLAKHTLSKHTDDSSILGALQIQLAHKRRQEQLLQQQIQFNKISSDYNSLFQLTNNNNNISTVDTAQLPADFFLQSSSNSAIYPSNNISTTLDSTSKQLTSLTSQFSTDNHNQDIYANVQQELSNKETRNPLEEKTEANSMGTTFENCYTETINKRPAKGIMYKNVYMQCIVNYHCSQCNTDLSTKLMKKEHRRSACFDGNSNRFSYIRHYSYLCPYCGEKFPSQKLCRQHQLSVCLVIMGVKTEELNYKQHNCPYCGKKYFNLITLKGHMTLAHKSDKLDIDFVEEESFEKLEDSVAAESVNTRYAQHTIKVPPMVPIPKLEDGPILHPDDIAPFKEMLESGQNELAKKPLRRSRSKSRGSTPTTTSPSLPASSSSSTTHITEPKDTDTKPDTTPLSFNTTVHTRGRKRGRGGRWPYRTYVLNNKTTPSATATLSRSLRSNPKNNRYFSKDFCLGDDLDYLETKLPRIEGVLKTDRLTRSALRPNNTTANHNEDDDDEEEEDEEELDLDTDATDDLTVDESMNGNCGNNDEQVNHDQQAGTKANIDINKPTNIASNANKPTDDKGGGESASKSQTYSLKVPPVENHHGGDQNDADTGKKTCPATNKDSDSSNNNADRQNLFEYMGFPLSETKSSESLTAGSQPTTFNVSSSSPTSSSNKDNSNNFNIDSLIFDKSVNDEENEVKEGTLKPTTSPPSSPSLVFKPKMVKSVDNQLFNTIYEKASTCNNKMNNNTINNDNGVKSDLHPSLNGSSKNTKGDVNYEESQKIMDTFEKNEGEKKEEETSGMKKEVDEEEVDSKVVIDIKKKTILKKLSNSLLMANKRHNQ